MPGKRWGAFSKPLNSGTGLIVKARGRQPADQTMTERPLKKNFLINMSGPLVRIAVALAIVPIYLHAVGAARYGVISILWALIGYTGFLDLGLSRASANALAKMRAAPQIERARVLTTTLVVNFALGLLGGCGLFLGAGLLLGHFISAPTELTPEITGALPWVAAMFPATLVSGVSVGVLNPVKDLLSPTPFKYLARLSGKSHRSFWR